MVGAVILVVAMLIVAPVAIMVGGAIWSALMGWALTEDADRRHADDPA